MGQLTKNFSLREFLVSDSAARAGISMTPPPQVEAAIKKLCEQIIQPVRDGIEKSVRITSGYRPPALNKLIGGSTTSQHCFGEAADFVVIGMDDRDVAKWIQSAKLPFDQLIWEFDEWVHVSVGVRSPARGQVLTAKRGADGKTVYTPGIG